MIFDGKLLPIALHSGMEGLLGAWIPGTPESVDNTQVMIHDLHGRKRRNVILFR